MNEYKKKFASPRSVFVQLTYDSIWTVACALRRTLNKLQQFGNTSSLARFSYKGGNEIRTILSNVMEDINFLGVSVSIIIGKRTESVSLPRGK